MRSMNSRFQFMDSVVFRWQSRTLLGMVVSITILPLYSSVQEPCVSVRVTGQLDRDGSHRETADVGLFTDNRGYVRLCESYFKSAVCDDSGKWRVEDG